MSTTLKEAKQLLIKAFGTGMETAYDFEGDPGLYLEGIAKGLKQAGFDLSDLLRLELNPSTMTQKIPDWEQSCGLSQTGTALFGSTIQRRNQVIGKLRENGSFSLADLRAAMQPYLLYADPNLIEINETDREILRANHTYSFAGVPVTLGIGSSVTLRVTVLDDPRVSPAGAQTNLVLTGDLNEVQFQLTGPGGASKIYPYGYLGTGTVTNQPFTLFAPAYRQKSLGYTVDDEFYEKPIRGVWTLFVSARGSAITISSASLFVEGLGRDSRGGDGLGSPMFTFATVIDYKLVGQGYNVEAAQVAVRHLTPAHCGASIVLKNAPGSQDDELCAIPDLPTSIPDQSYPCIRPTTAWLHAVFSLSSTSYWAAGSDGKTVYYDSFNWVEVATPTTQILWGLWGAYSNFVIAVGNQGTILRYNGTAWLAMTSGVMTHLLAVWGSADNNVWAVGEGGTILNYDGTSWNSATSPTTNILYGIWGSSSSNIWAVGEGGTIVRYNGTTWSTVVSPTTQDLYGIFGLSASDIWAVGDAGTILHYDGMNWSTVVSPTSFQLYSVWGNAANNLWAVGSNVTTQGIVLRYNGTVWSIVSINNTSILDSITGTGMSDIWTVGKDGALLHYNGTSFDIFN